MAVIQTSGGTNISTITNASISETGFRADNKQVRATYRASTTATVAFPNGTTPFVTLYGSATKTVSVTGIFFTGTIATAAANVILLVSKRSSVFTGGTPSAMTATPMDGNDAAATATVAAYTAGPTAGALVGTIESRRCNLLVTGAVATQDVFFNYNTTAAKPIVLRGTGQGIDLSFQTAPGNAVAGTVWIEWTEE